MSRFLLLLALACIWHTATAGSLRTRTNAFAFAPSLTESADVRSNHPLLQGVQKEEKEEKKKKKKIKLIKPKSTNEPVPTHAVQVNIMSQNMENLAGLGATIGTMEELPYRRERGVVGKGEQSPILKLSESNLKGRNFDFLTIQEVTDIREDKYPVRSYFENVITIKEALTKGSDLHGREYGHCQDSHSNAIIYRSDRWKLEKSLQIPRPDFDNRVEESGVQDLFPEHNGVYYWHKENGDRLGADDDPLQIENKPRGENNGDIEKYTFAARFKLKHEDFYIWVVCIHLKAVGVKSSKMGAGNININNEYEKDKPHKMEILNIMRNMLHAARNEPILFGGDFNDMYNIALMEFAMENSDPQGRGRELKDFCPRDDDGKLINTQSPRFFHETEFKKEWGGKILNAISMTSFDMPLDGMFSLHFVGGVQELESQVLDMSMISDHQLLYTKLMVTLRNPGENQNEENVGDDWVDIAPNEVPPHEDIPMANLNDEVCQDAYDNILREHPDINLDQAILKFEQADIKGFETLESFADSKTGGRDAASYRTTFQPIYDMAKKKAKAPEPRLPVKTHSQFQDYDNG